MRCMGTNKKGQPCQSPVIHLSEYCYFHHPEMQAERRASQGKGGRNRSYFPRTPGPVLQHFDLRDPDMRAELINFTVNQVLSNKLEPSMGFLVIQAAYVMRAEQAAALKESETVKDFAPLEKTFDLPLLQLPETSVRQILGGHNEEALQDLYDEIIAYEESKPTDAPANHDSPKEELADASAAREPAQQKTSIQFLKSAVIYFLNKYFWNRMADEAERYVPGHIPSYLGKGIEFLGLPESQVRMRLSGFESEALEDLLRAIDQLEEQKPEETGSENAPSESVPLSLYGNGHVTPELLKKMVRFFLDKKKEAIEERLRQRRLYEEQLEKEYGPSAVPSRARPAKESNTSDASVSPPPPECCSKPSGESHAAVDDDRSLSAPPNPSEFAGSSDEVPPDPSPADEEGAPEPGSEESEASSLSEINEEYQAKAEEYLLRLSDNELSRRLSRLRGGLLERLPASRRKPNNVSDLNGRDPT